MSRFPGMVCSLLVFSALPGQQSHNQRPEGRRQDDANAQYGGGGGERGSYFLYSETILMRSSVEILLLSCLKSGEKRDSLSSVP